VQGLKGQHLVALGYPAKDDGELAFFGERSYLPGLYRLRLTLRPSHTANAIAFRGGLRVECGDGQVDEFSGIQFARVHQPETRTVSFMHREAGPLSIALVAQIDPKVCETTFTAAKLKDGGPTLKVELLPGEGGADEEGEDVDDLVFMPAPHKAFYYVLDKAEVTPVSLSGHVSRVTVNKIRYEPGETLKGSAIVQDVGGKGGRGTLSLFLEHDVRTREKVRELPVTLTEQSQQLEFSLALPRRELGHALVAVYTSEDGQDTSEATEYFNIADNFFRVAIHGNIGGHGHSKRTPEQIRETIEKALPTYMNCTEYFAWAEEDMVEMSPQTDWWFSGQTNYHLRKKGLQDVIRIAHEYGISSVTYGKFIMSGYLGWKTAYDYPNDHKGQYFYPVGMWEGVNVLLLDRFKYKEFVPYAYRPHIRGERVFDVWWSSFMPINPDHTPRMARIAAEEVIRSIEMFGWDAIRWDGHPRGGGQCGGAGRYDHLAARRTQALVRYFKDIVSAKYPKFRHGYNYLFVQGEPSYNWAYEDFELDELCRGGGLCMNESIRNSAGRPFEWIAKNIQVEGDLCRERGGYLLGISCDGASDRDVLVEAILYFAGGCRPMGAAASSRLVNRYGTRYSRYTFDERLRRLAKPEGVLRPLTETHLWWQPFVYETPPNNGRKQLVVNLLNIPRRGAPKREGDTREALDMCAGTDPVTLELTLPNDHRAVGAHFIDPFALTVSLAKLQRGKIQVPPTAVWRVLVVDLETDDGSTSLADQFGSPRTFGVQRKAVDIERTEPVTLDIEKAIVEVNKDMSHLRPGRGRGAARKEPDLDTLNWDERNRQVLAIKNRYPPETFIKGWWKGGSMPADLKLKDEKFDFGDLTPERNGRLDVFYGRGAIDYRLRMNEIFAGFPRYHVHDAPLQGLFRQSPGQRLRSAIHWRRYREKDLLLYTSIPHCAIGVENSYALVGYVRAGGAILLTGGEYAFGKGGYTHTVLDRKLLPVHCVETVDTKYTETPLALEPGPDFEELGVEIDFSLRPSFWCWNQVAVKDGDSVKVFLKCGNRPILVAWRLGKGRVACFLVAHRGRSEGGVTAFFDWQDWPELTRALIRWLAPDAWHTEPVRMKPVSKPRIAEIREQLEEDLFSDEGKGIEETEQVDDMTTLPGEAGPAPTDGGPSRELGEKALKQRIALLDEALQAGQDGMAALLAEQLGAVTNLPVKTRDAVVDFVRRHPPTQLAEIARRFCKHPNTVVRSSGHQLLAISGSDAFPTEFQAKAPAFETNPLNRQRFLAIGLVMYPKRGLQALGEKRVREWNTTAAAIKDRWTGGKDFSLAAPAHPCLDAETLFQRVAWLAYLTREKPEVYGAQFAREWLMTAQYQDYCDRSIGNLWGMNMSPADTVRAKILTREWGELRAFFARLRNLTRPDLERLLKGHHEQVAEGFVGAHFTLEARQCINFLANYSREETRPVLEALKGAKHPMLVAFANARLAGR